MKIIYSFLLILSLCSFCCGQTPGELYAAKNYKELVKLARKPDNLSAGELYMVGFAFFQLENDAKAVEFYDKAMAKGLNDGAVHFYKGLSLRYQKNYEEALKEIELSLVLEPSNQEYMNEKGIVFYFQEKYDKALEVFEEAKKLPNTYPEPYFWAARIHEEKKDLSTALAGYYEAVKILSEENSLYMAALTSIGELEYTTTKDYLKSAWAYTRAIQLDQEDYTLYYDLMKSYNAAREYTKADSVFNLVQAAYKNKQLPREDMEARSVEIAEFEWNGQTAVVRRSLIAPKKSLDVSYKVFLLDKDKENIERRFLVEKTIQTSKDGPKHLLCEYDRKSGEHITYSYGWNTDHIPLEGLQEAVILVLDGKLKKGASSNSGK